ncbi:MAG TPA: sigma-70 family RNA polymerase sigma factor [Chthonomonadaceae bacterium]|nr:sigma-70 family RNA polymerase sigma factor [Chthonomonadaceae bacterium]
MRSYLPDQLLARRAAAGHLEDFEELLRRYRDRVYRICYRMAGNAEDAQDWTQECFVRVYRQLHHYDSGLPFAPWLLRVASNTCVNLAKSRAHHQSKLGMSYEEDHEMPSSIGDPLRSALSGEEARQVQAAVAALPPMLKQAVVLRVVEGLSFRELAETLGIPLQTAASRVRRALLQVREQLEQVESEVEQ